MKKILKHLTLILTAGLILNFTGCWLDIFGGVGEEQLPSIDIEFGGLTVARNDIIDIGEEVVNNTKGYQFTLKNTGLGKLTLSGNQPVKINDETSIFTVTQQPASSGIDSGSSLTFQISFNPKANESYSATVRISSNDPNPTGDFIFTIAGTGITTKPIAAVFYEEAEILQNGLINAGEMLATQTKNITITIRNTGTELLTVDAANITITGADAAAFTQLTTPSGNIPVGNQTSFIIR